MISVRQTGCDALQNLLQRAVDANTLAGVSVLVQQHGRDVFYGEAGYASLETHAPIQRDTIFRLYSMSKPITSAAAMLLLERGLLDLEDPVSDYLPGFSGKKTTLRHLLTMTSGLVYGGDTPAGQQYSAVFNDIVDRLRTDSPMTTQEAANRLGQCDPIFEPGTDWCYGSSADVMGAVIEVASGMRFGEFLQREFFDPLDMHDTGFYVPQEKQHRLASAYHETPDGLKLYTGDNLGILNRMEKAPVFESGGAGLASTLDDFSHFSRMLLDGGSYAGRTILSPATVRYYTTSRLEAHQQAGWDKRWNNPGFTYGNFMRIMFKPEMFQTMGSLGEYGWDGWLGCYFCNAPADDLTLLMMMQRVDTGVCSLTRRVRNVVFSSIS